MATIQHVDITDPEVHEPKGASTASNGTIYVSDGAGSGAWTALNYEYHLTASLADISTASFILIPVIKSGTVVQARIVLANAITVADAVVTFKNAAGASMGTGVTVATAGSAEGTAYTFTPSGNNVLTGPTYIKVESDGGSTTTAILSITVEIQATL